MTGGAGRPVTGGAGCSVAGEKGSATAASRARVRRVREAIGSLGVKAVLLAYWGTAFAVSMGRKKPQVGVEESVRRKA